MAETMADLLQRCRTGDESAVRLLVERFAPAARDLAVAILNDRHLAEDAVQAALVTALGRLDQLRQPDAFAAWLRQIVRTQAHRILRKRQEQVQDLLDDRPAAGACPQEALQRRERQEMVRRALARVSDVGRQAAELYYFEDFSLAQIAQRLGVPQGTVKRRLHDVPAQLRNLLLGYITEPEPPPQPPDEFRFM